MKVAAGGEDARRGRSDRGDRGDRGGNGHERPGRPVEPEVRTEREEYGPPPGYQPIILPGESISKYRGVAQAAPALQTSTGALLKRPWKFQKMRRQRRRLRTRSLQTSLCSPRRDTKPRRLQAFRRLQNNQNSLERAASPVHFEPEVGSEDWEREQKRLHQMNVAAVFGGEEVAEEEEEEQDDDRYQRYRGTLGCFTSCRCLARLQKRRSTRKRPTWFPTSRTSKKTRLLTI